jgi:DNA-binding NarL/FixJ family response regulator
MIWQYFSNRPKVKMKVFLTDDHEMMLDGLSSLLRQDSTFDIVGTACSCEETLDQIGRLSPDLLITDYNLPDHDGLYLVRIIKRKYPEIKIIVLSMHDEGHLVKEILKEGVDGYILKKDSHNDLMHAIRAVKSGKMYVSSDINQLLLRGLDGVEEQQLLTQREREVLTLIAEELTNRQIAEKLFISERTVETHRKNILRKTGTNNTVGLIKYAYANNLI